MNMTLYNVCMYLHSHLMNYVSLALSGIIIIIIVHVGPGVNGSQNAPELIYRDMRIQNFPGGACPQTPQAGGALCQPLTVVHLGVSAPPSHFSWIRHWYPLQCIYWLIYFRLRVIGRVCRRRCAPPRFAPTSRVSPRFARFANARGHTLLSLFHAVSLTRLVLGDVSDVHQVIVLNKAS